jgi:sensory rhodopsin
MEWTTVVYIFGTLGMLVGIPPAIALVSEDAGLDFDYLYLITGIAALMYAAMTFDIGSISAQGYHVPIPRYIDWALTTPLLVAYAAYVAGASRKWIGGLALVDFLMIAFGVGAVFLSGTGQWIFYGLSSICHISLLVSLYGPIRTSALSESAFHRRLARLLLNFIGLLWLAYPIVWMFGPGLQLVGADGVAVIITYLDVTAKVPFVYFIYRARKNFQRAQGSEGRSPSESPSAAGAPA